MIIHKVNDTTELVYTANRSIDFNSVITKLNYSGNKDVSIHYSHSYSPEGYNKPVITTKLEKGNKTTYIMGDAISFNYSDVSNLLSELRYFGDKAVIRFKGRIFGNNYIKYKEHSIKDSEGKIVTFKKSTVAHGVKGIDNFIHRMKMDNGQMLIPIIKRYVNTILLFRGKKKFLTGYANLEDYLNFIRSPSKDLLNSFDESITDGDFVIEIDPRSPEMKLKTNSVEDDKLIVDLFVDGDLKSADEPERHVPHVLMSTKPIRLLNQSLPYFISRQSRMSIFITPLNLKSDKILKDMKGGINLLK